MANIHVLVGAFVMYRFFIVLRFAFTLVSLLTWLGNMVLLHKKEASLYATIYVLVCG